MNGFKIVPDIDFSDAYANAKKDMIKALNSAAKLNPMQKRALLEELFGIANVEIMLKILRDGNFMR